MRLTSTVAAVALSVGLAAPAIAADLGPVEQAPPPFTWTGVYAGINLGYGWGDVDYDFATSGHYNYVSGDSFGHSIDGWLFGGQLGYNYQFDNVVVGLEAMLDWADVGKSDVVGAYNPTSDRWETKVGWFGTITPRLGYAFDRTLVYAKGGFAFGNVKNYVHDNSDYVEKSSTRTGWVVGAGVEYAFSNNITLGVEYNYVDLGSFRVDEETSSLSDGLPDGDFTNHTVDTTFSTVAVRLGYKF